MSDLTQTVREALAAATPGPWAYVEPDGRHGADPWIDADPDPISQFFGREADAHLIAAAPAWLAELCDRLEAAEGELAAVRRLVTDWQANSGSRPLGDPTAETWNECARQLLRALDGEQP